ncbi:MAG: hypothetical protein CMC13_10525 [Flavobacteriaceae bacterium]|nr:hypothetical protein [Flavobacteriaceae bacterium]|tara:strand:+ start:3534 stop:4508 length:975 start_codon:yes stop_codon:yes gene_type:complete
MILPDDKITRTRVEMFQSDSQNFDDVCFTIYKCPSCGKEDMELTLLPITSKYSYTDSDLQNTREHILNKIFDAGFDFLHQKINCDCTTKAFLELKRIAYCHNLGVLDIHYYIDYPFEVIKKTQVDLTKTANSKKFLLFDTETTGLPKDWKASYKVPDNWPRLVQIAWMLVESSGKIIEKNDYIVKPEGFQIPISSTAIHRISAKNALNNGNELHFVLNQFNECVKKADFIVAHNVNFDLNIVASEFFQSSIDTEIYEKSQICTMKSSQEFCKIIGNYGYKYPKLSELHLKLFNTTFNEAHDATVDIKATYHCFIELLKKDIIKY